MQADLCVFARGAVMCHPKCYAQARINPSTLHSFTERKHEFQIDNHLIPSTHHEAETSLKPRSPTHPLQSNQHHPNLRSSKRPRCNHVPTAPMSLGTFGGATPRNTLDNARYVTRLDDPVRNQLPGLIDPANGHVWSYLPSGCCALRWLSACWRWERIHVPR